MSTSKIGKSFNPKKAVNPNYGKVEQPKKEEVDKIEKALTLLHAEVEILSELVKQQNEAFKLVFEKLDNLSFRIDKMEQNTKKTISENSKQVTEKISEEVESLKSKEEEKPKKMWFK